MEEQTPKKPSQLKKPKKVRKPTGIGYSRNRRKSLKAWQKKKEKKRQEREAKELELQRERHQLAQQQEAAQRMQEAENLQIHIPSWIGYLPSAAIGGWTFEKLCNMFNTEATAIMNWAYQPFLNGTQLNDHYEYLFAFGAALGALVYHNKTNGGRRLDLFPRDGDELVDRLKWLAGGVCLMRLNTYISDNSEPYKDLMEQHPGFGFFVLGLTYFRGKQIVDRIRYSETFSNLKYQPRQTLIDYTVRTAQAYAGYELTQHFNVMSDSYMVPLIGAIVGWMTAKMFTSPWVNQKIDNRLKKGPSP